MMHLSFLRVPLNTLWQSGALGWHQQAVAANSFMTNTRAIYCQADVLHWQLGMNGMGRGDVHASAWREEHQINFCWGVYMCVLTPECVARGNH